MPWLEKPRIPDFAVLFSPLPLRRADLAVRPPGTIPKTVETGPGLVRLGQKKAREAQQCEEKFATPKIAKFLKFGPQNRKK